MQNESFKSDLMESCFMALWDSDDFSYDANHMPHKSAKAYRSYQPVYVQQLPSLSFWTPYRHGPQSSVHRFSNRNLFRNDQECYSLLKSNIVAGIDCLLGWYQAVYRRPRVDHVWGQVIDRRQDIPCLENDGDLQSPKQMTRPWSEQLLLFAA